MNGPPESQASSRPPFQLSLRTLLGMMANVAALLAAMQIPGHALSGYGVFVKGAGVLLSIYVWRFQANCWSTSPQFRLGSLGIILAVCLPFMIGGVGSIFRESGISSLWLGTPVWLGAIPLLSCVFHDLNRVPCVELVRCSSNRETPGDEPGQAPGIGLCGACAL